MSFITHSDDRPNQFQLVWLFYMTAAMAVNFSVALTDVANEKYSYVFATLVFVWCVTAECNLVLWCKSKLVNDELSLCNAIALGLPTANWLLYLSATSLFFVHKGGASRILGLFFGVTILLLPISTLYCVSVVRSQPIRWLAISSIVTSFCAWLTIGYSIVSHLAQTT